jgi:CubicO group peptidase (beta-lactamase class C family)
MKRLVSVCALLAGILRPAVAETTGDPARALLDEAVGAGVLHGVSAVVVTPAGTRTLHAGRRSPGGAAMPDDRTLYEIGSVTKVFTALLLADAVVRGEVTLETPIAELLPAGVSLPGDAARAITLEMLATHRSGLPRIPAELDATDYRDPYAAYGEDELWATLRSVRLEFAPGERAAYSNLGAGLLGTLLARRAGVSYGELLAARITGPLGMTDTVVEVAAADSGRVAPPHTGAGEPWSSWHFRALAGAGAIRSSVADLGRFGRAVLDPESTPLGAAIELAWKVRDRSSGLSPGGNALGWLLAGDGATRWHNGMTGGYHAAVFVHRDLGVAVAVATNRSTPAATGIAEQLTRLAAGLPAAARPHADRAEVALTDAQLDRLVGTYRLSPTFLFVVERRNRSLYLTPTGQPTDRLYAASETLFFSRNVPAEIDFELAAGGGSAVGLVLRQGGRETPGRREP